MLIEKVELKNIKPYKERTFTFAPGINVLSGPNGAGKSTVFEAIGYALFGVEAKRFIGKAERFVRKGARQGFVRVHFQADDGRHYVVERGAGRNTLRRLLEKRADGAEEVIPVKDDRELERLLKKILNLAPDGGDLAEQFLNVIGPLQSEFLGPFVKRGQPRTDEFDRILGISAWREAFEQSLALEREARTVIEQKRQLVEEKRAGVATYDQVVADLTKAQAGLRQKREELAKVEAEARHIAHQVAAFEQAKVEMERLEGQLHQVHQQKARFEEALQAVERRLAEARAARKICDDSAASHAAYRQAEGTLKKLREQDRTAKKLREKLQALDAEISSERGRIEAEEKNLSERERELSEELQRMRTHVTSLEEELRTLEREDQHARSELEAFHEFLAKGDELPTPSSIRDAAARYIDELLSVEIEIEDYRQRLSQREALEAAVKQAEMLEKRLKDLERQRAILDARRLQLEEGKQKLARGQCPFFEEGCLNLEQKAGPPTTFFGQRLAEVTSELEAIVGTIDSVTADLQQAQAARNRLVELAEVENQLVRAEQRKNRVMKELEKTLDPYVSGAFLERVHRWIELAPPPRDELSRILDSAGALVFQQTNGLRALREAIEAFSRHLDDLLHRIRWAAEARRNKLDEIHRQTRERYAWCDGQRRQAEEILKKLNREMELLAHTRVRLEQDRRMLAGKITERDSLADQVRLYDDLSERIAEQEHLLSIHQAGYREFEQNIRLAGQLESTEQEAKDIEQRIAVVTGQIVELEEKVAAVRSAYDENAYREARKRQHTLVAAQAALSTEVDTLQSEVTRLEAEKTRMDHIRQALGEAEREIEQYQSTLQFIEDCRAHVFNKVSEQLSERFREEVSQIADRIYRAISARDEELRWGPDYRIELVDFREGNERIRYDEELSGGEMVNAVVALRLALLQMTGSKVGFFDEPTSHLDEVRRANLAQAFRHLHLGQSELGRPWYDQLFLISHDVSFTEITDQIIYLTGTDRTHEAHAEEMEE